MPGHRYGGVGVFALILVFGVFAIVVFMIRMKVPLGISLVSGAVLVAFLFGMGPADTGGAILEICSQPGTGAFVLLIALVLALSMVLERSGQIDRLTELDKGCLVIAGDD